MFTDYYNFVVLFMPCGSKIKLDPFLGWTLQGFSFFVVYLLVSWCMSAWAVLSLVYSVPG